jgi:hypothetical protein
MKTLLLLAGVAATNQLFASNIRCEKAEGIGGDPVSISWDTTGSYFERIGSYHVQIGYNKFELVPNSLGLKKTQRVDHPQFLVNEIGYWVDRHRVYLRLAAATTESTFGYVVIESEDLAKGNGLGVTQIYRDQKTRKLAVNCKID